MDLYKTHGGLPPFRSRTRRFVWILSALILIVGAGIGGYLLWPRLSPQEAAQTTPAPTNKKETASQPKQVGAPTVLEEEPTFLPNVKPDVFIPPIENGLAPVISTIPTKQPVVFLGIDDGAYKDPSELALMKQINVRASLFLTYNVIADNTDFFKDFIAAGSLVENHTITHTHLTTLGYEGQKREICGQADLMQQLYGRRPVLFRPPGGHYNTTTQRAAADCGMKAVVMWIAKANGGSMQYQIGNGLRPGDIVLMHFRSEFQQDLQAFVNAMNAAGLRTELLSDWLSS